MTMWNANRIEKRAVADKVEHNIHFLCFGQPFGKFRALHLHSLRPKSEELFKTRLIARRCYHVQPRIGRNVQGRLAESGSSAAEKESLPLFDSQVAVETGPCCGVRLRYHRELLPRQVPSDLHHVCCWDKRQLGVTTIDRSAHAAHECSDFVAGMKFSLGCCNDLTHALDSADLGGLSPLPPAHMGFGMIHAERFNRNQDMASFCLRVRQFLNHQAFNPAKTIQYDCAHLDASQLLVLQIFQE